ncbi:MAG: class I SAM-dependent methyltransferase [Bacteroidetes bacterium]|nr:class I SAM-dependent methyltransferase [Bacteroidota bacterium]
MLAEQLCRPAVQTYIEEQIDADIQALSLKGFPFSDIPASRLASQIAGKKIAKTKFPSWFSQRNLIFPEKINLEQTSSEATAVFKASLFSGEKMVDLTGGWGVDAYWFSQRFEKVFYCERNRDLREIVSHNFQTLHADNIQIADSDAWTWLHQTHETVDLIYLDPSRRSDSGKKVYKLQDCEPDVKAWKAVLLTKSENVLIKTSPLLDITQTLVDLENVKNVWVVSVNREVKELLFHLQRDFSEEPTIHVCDTEDEITDAFNFLWTEESATDCSYALPQSYLYEPFPGIMKSGGFKVFAHRYGLQKLHSNSHLYTSQDLVVGLPARSFKIEEVCPFQKKQLKREWAHKACNISVRNFKMTVAEIRKQFKIKDGGDVYLFFTTDKNQKAIMLNCSKIEPKQPIA